MRRYTFIWADDDNIPHLAEHGVRPEEAEYVVEHADPENCSISRTTGNPIAFGFTRADRYLAVIYWMVNETENLVYVETAYDVPLRPGRRSNRS